MYYDEEGCLTVFIRGALLAFFGVVAGLFFGYYFVGHVTLPFVPKDAIIKRIPPQTRTIIHSFNAARKKVYLLPGEIRELYRSLSDMQLRLSDSEQQLLTERQFKDQLVKQSLDTKPYIVISLADNMLYLKQKDKILRSCRVATGRQSVEVINGHTYRFFTPRTIFTITWKQKDPKWTAPDWAFHEQGVEPPPVAERRAIPGVLGKYALHLQSGYIIHGTINNASLGKYITHGCVRMDERDLKAVYDFVPVGTKVYIY